MVLVSSRMIFGYVYPLDGNVDIPDVGGTPVTFTFDIGGVVYTFVVVMYLHDFADVLAPGPSTTVRCDDLWLLCLSKGAFSVEEICHRHSGSFAEASAVFHHAMQCVVRGSLFYAMKKYSFGSQRCFLSGYHVGGVDKDSMLLHMSEDDPVTCKHFMDVNCHDVPEQVVNSAVDVYNEWVTGHCPSRAHCVYFPVYTNGSLEESTEEETRNEEE